MKPMESFLMLYYLLHQCQEIDPGDLSSGELILSDLLSGIDPTLWADGRPMDQAIYRDWLEQTDISRLNRGNIISAVLSFVSLYENRGFYFGIVREILLGPERETMIASAERFTKCMYHKHNYPD